MAVIGRRNHALAFNGVNDSIIIPQGRMTRLGQATTEGTKSPLPILGESAHGTKDGDLLSGEFYDTMTIEAWVIPDCGGVIVEKEGMFSLSIGNVDTPGPAVFEVLIDTPAGLETVRLATATDVTTRYEGTVYPPANLGGMHDSYNRFTGSDDGTSLNINHRPLIHVVASLSTTSADLSINGEIMVRKEMKNKDFKIAQSDNHVYVGGKGGQFRGVMEALHIGTISDGSVTSSNPPLVNPSSLLLYRFEEPIAPIEGSYNFTTMSTNSGLTRLTISSADAITLATKLTGESKTSGDVDFTVSPYSSGNYKVIDRKNTTTYSVAHVPYNLLINPDVVNPNTKKPNQSPPERVRLHSITDIGDSPYLTVSSIHLEFDSSSYPANPLRPVLHTRTDNVDKHFVVVGADLLVDNDSGKPYQPPHLATQIIDRTGQMVIDESGWGQHGFVFSNRMSTTTSDTDNPFAVTWPSGLDERYQIGHSGRHIANHVDGHEYLRMLPRATDEIVDQQIDGSSDIIEIIYDDTQRGIEKQVTINAEVDVFREQKAFEITDLVNSSTATAIFHNGLPDENKEIIAIGGAVFDYRPFMLKGPVPTIKSTVNTETRRYHARPSKISRVALLSVPGLATYDMAPFIEVHYNAVDLTGESMSGVVTAGSFVTDTQYKIISTGNTNFTLIGAANNSVGTVFTATGVGSGTGTAQPYQPFLMVEKTVPAGSTVVSGTTTVYSLMNTAITSSGVDSTLYAPGGYVDVRTAGLALGGGLDKPHTLIGDTSEGYEGDDELDESLVPVNYNPMVITGTLVNRVAGYAVNTTSAMVVDGEDAEDYMEVGSVLYNSLGLKIGVITAMTSTSITMSAGTLVALVNNEAFYLADANAIPNITPQIVTASHTTTTSHDSVFHRMVISDANSKNSSLTDKGLYSRREPTSVPSSPSAGEFDKGGTASSTNIHEMFDVIDNAEVLGKAFPTTRLFIQPSDRRRVNQLTNLRSLLSDIDESNMVTLMYLMSRAKVRSVGESESEHGSYVTIRCTSLSDALVNRTVNFRGKGSPDSYIVKEIEPNAPVVTATLGGPGQGAVDTKPTYDPSPLARLPFSTRRNCATLGDTVTANSSTKQITVKPLNNLATDLASWGTYGFPKKGRVYLQDGSSALYNSKSGTTFTFTDGSFGDGKFLLADGTEFKTFYEWLVATEIHGSATSSTSETAISVVLFNDEFFDESALAEDGTTVNDRMFQSMSDVQHDYQLGTQYASTRAMVEIPFFANQFFDDEVRGIYPGPDNSMKVHIDATHTAHTYNPSPVGRRPLDKPANDREAHSAFSFNKARNRDVPFTFVKEWTGIIVTEGGGHHGFRLYVENVSIFPIVNYSVADSSYQNVDEVRRYRRVFLASGAWAFYIGNGADYLRIPDDSTWGYSDTFMEEVKTGVAVFMSGPQSAEELVPIGSDALVPSSDYEGRGEYYHDTASVKTQGGNVDYGLRQYVSAVEFKAGPESNPHAPRIKSKRARGTVKTLKSYLDIDDDGTAYIKQIVVTMDDEEMVLFPDDIHGEDMSTATFDTGDFLYEAETVESNGTIRKMHYYGKLSRDSDSNILNNNALVFVYKSTTNASTTDSWVTNLVGNEIYLSRRTRRILGVNYGMNDSSSPANNELKVATYKPSGPEQWLITSDSQYDTVSITNSNGRMIGSSLSGLNLRVGDSIYADSTGVIDRIGIAEQIEDYDGATYTVTLTQVANKTVSSKPLRLGIDNAFAEDRDGWLNTTWNHPYAPGGLRNGDTVWANMTMNNPYAVEGLFSKSRGVFNEAQVWTGFNGGVGALDSANPRDSIPLENFLIGDTCLETAINYVQHVNKTVEENYKTLGLTIADAPTVAYVDPYLAEDGHARVLLYDVAHDREFVAFQDLHMQVQTSADAVKIGWPRHQVYLSQDDATDLAALTVSYNGGGPSILTTQIDVANGFPSQNPYIRSTQQSKFIESAYAHDVANRLATTVLNPLSGLLPTGGGSLPSNAAKLTTGAYGKAHGHHVHTGYTLAGSVEDLSVGDSCLPRTQDASVLPLRAQKVHNLSRIKRSIDNSFVMTLVKTRLDGDGASFRDGSTTFDTPDGTRVIPAFLCLKGIRNSTLDLTGHEETRLQHLKQWTHMDFVRRLSIDAGEVGIRNGVVSVETATQEIVRIINQAAAPKAQVIVDGNTTGSAHDPIPWWDGDKAFSSRDRGSHMGYLRAHIGRPVQDLDGNLGHTIVIHSTVPGATGRNFCVWLDNSKGQSTYKPQFLIGHGGRWRNFWALPEEKEGENMHPAPMPLNKHGRPFAPITTLQQYVTPENSGEEVSSVADFINAGDDTNPVLRAISNSVGGGSQFNTVNEESFETEGSSSTFVQGLRTGNRAISRINFGGMVASGVPGFAPDAGDWGFGQKGSQQFRSKYGSIDDITYTNHVPSKAIKTDNVGAAPLYGLQFEDHRGGKHGIRFIYRKVGESFANENTPLPDTIDNEVCVFFDDNDIAQGGFTIGKHMRGSDDATGRMQVPAGVGIVVDSWCGNVWRGVKAPNILVDCDINGSTSTMTVTLGAPFNSGGNIESSDVLGYLGFPAKNGLIHITDSEGTSDGGAGYVGIVASYTHRTRYDKSGSGTQHKFFGVQYTNSIIAASDFLISPVLNWTTIVTDELMAAVTAAAVNASSSQINSSKGLSFDCTKMYATDGRTFGQWGISKDAIKIRAYDSEKDIKGLSQYFSASLHRDLGIQAAHLEFGEVEKTENASTGWAFGTSRMASDSDLEKNENVDCGYIPNTILQIQSMSRGPNSNTATPLLVDSFNNPVNTIKWKKGLTGESYTRISGDHILPCIDNPIAVYDTQGDDENWDGTDKTLPLDHEMWNFLIPAGQETNSTGVLINNGGGYAQSTASAMTVDGTDATDEFIVNAEAYTSNGTLIGTITGVTSTSITMSGGTAVTLSDNDEIYAQRIKSFGEKRTIWLNENEYIIVESSQGSTSLTALKWYDEGKSNDWPVTEPTNSVVAYENVVFSHYGDIKRTREFDGLRSLGSVLSEPIVYFRGGKSSSDHSVPLFFGGGFSGVTLDINDGTMNDYSSFYTHPYANGPTGTTGIQNANEISTSFALLDCNAMFAFFPGTPFCNQHRGSITPPAFNKDSVLSPDLAHGDGVIHGSHPNNTPYTAGVAVQKPSPLILRFAHPTARYEDHRGGTDSKTTYMIFGPGQAFPFNQEVADDDGQSRWNAKQPHTGKVVVVGNTWAKVPSRYATPFLPNHIDNNDGNFMPPDFTYQLARGRFHWRTVMNWEPPQGKPNIGKLSQRPEHGRMYGQNFTPTTPTSGIDTDLDTAHPMRHCSMLGFSVAMAADMVFHMDGGYHPGGHWMDNQISFNPSHPKSDTILTGWGPTTQIHPSAFRVAGPISTKVLTYAATEGDLVAADTDKEYIIVDATRCQNGEELATVLGAAVNAFPGAGALKAMGGTHMPSMGNAMRQDRYGWIETTYVNNSITHLDSKPKNNHISVTITNKTTNNPTNRAYLEQIPACGWLRADATVESGNAAFAPYFAREIHDDSGLEVKFYLAPNRITNSLKFESRDTWYKHTGSPDPVEYPTFVSGTKIHVWSKAGVHRFNNEVSTTRDHMCQVHFSGLVDAIDRTRPIGSVGWAGERYSYLNSLKVGTEGYAAGLSAWHPMLGFSPYGKASSAMNVLGHSPLIAPMPRSPESLPPIDGLGNNLMSHMNSPTTAFNMELHTLSYHTSTTTLGQTKKSTDAPIISGTKTDAPYTLHSKPPIYVDNSIPEALTHPQGVFGRAFVVVSYECESALIGKYDRDGITALGDWLQVKGAAADSISNPITFAGTTRWDERFHGQDRFVAPANAGPNVEALVHKAATIPSISFTTDHAADLTPFNAEYNLHASNLADSYLENAVPSLNKTGDLLFDLDHSIGSYHLESNDAERNVAADFYTEEDITQEYDISGTEQINDFWAGDINAFAMHSRAPSKNFTVENIVWKRMDGGNLSLPAINARGLGAVPWMTRVEGGVGYTTGEKIFGNVRFTFETTNSAMLPVLQAQELSHPQLASKHPYEIGNILEIPNEEMQFEEITVVDDSGQEHILEGGSPLGTIIRGFKRITDRGVQGSAPSLANSGVAPNLKIQLPDPDTIPGNIVVRSGFDRLQAYQNETMGSGGMIHPDLSETHIGNLFDNSVSGPRKGPTYEDHNWEHIDPLTKDSTVSGWGETTGNAPLRTSYEQHDRALYFHVTKMGHSHTHRYPTVYTHANNIVNQNLTVSAWDSATSKLTMNANIDLDVYAAGFGSKEISDNRRFIRIYNVNTEESVLASYTGIGVAGSPDERPKFLGVVGDVDFTAFMAAQTLSNLRVVPSYYIPAGSNRFFAARRLRDHAEVSGNSPDMAKTQYFPTNWNANSSSQVLAHTIYSKPVMTPMPLPRMGHHFVTPTMPMLPGHWAHPAYQGLYRKHMAENASLRGYADRNRFLDDSSTTPTRVYNPTTDVIPPAVTDYLYPLDPEIAFGSLNAAPSGPSDIHGGAFTLMFETKIRYDGYGILASVGIAGTVNKVGGHTILLEAGGNYTQDKHFPDPAEVGAYQIIIQPNTHANQLVGHHYYGSTNSLTGQQVNTVIGIKIANDTTGALGLVLAEATQADVRGCEIFINEVMLDQNPDFGEQLANIAPLSLYNQFGIAGTESPAFTRRAFGYSPSLFSNSTPGYTVNIPWWSILHKVGPDYGTGFRHLAHHRLDNYYEVSRNTLGSIGVQLTIAGYPSIYPDIYSRILQNTSLNPKCIVKGTPSGGTITVDDASTFLEVPYYDQLLEFTDSSGVVYTSDYDYRTGLIVSYLNQPKQFTGVPTNTAFWNKLVAMGDGTELRLTRAYNMLPAGDIFTNTKKSIFTHILPQVLTGTRDTTSLHIPDAYLCLWNPNLGRPHTFYSDSSRTWLNLTSDRAVDKKPYNSMPEHFETIHYQDSIHAMSLGPFDFRIKTPSKASKDGTLIVASGSQSAGGQDVNENYIMYSKFWPCGSRGGPLVSRLEVYTQSSVSWSIPRKYAPADLYGWKDEDVLAADYTLANSGVTITSALTAGTATRYPYGYRIAVRQACNRPRWGLIPARAKLEDDSSGLTDYTVGYQAGPLVQSETRTWTYAGGDSSQSSPSITYPTTYTGIMERQTNFAGMLNVDKPEWQVRYSEGRRMTRPFGAPVRALRNNSNQDKDWWGDIAGKGITSVSEAAQYYLVDWWGNERGEDVRRAPVRGFGIRPAWDCGDAYEYDRTNSRTPHARIWNNGKPIFEVTGIIGPDGGLDSAPPRFCGSDNERNNSLSDANAIMVDAFAPTHAMRIGDMGNGRGVRYPIQFNEDILTELSEPVHTTGVVLSHNTAEPLFGNGLLRPRNAVLQADEVPRGISARLGVAENGLLKPDAVVSDRVEEISGVSPHKDAISRTSPRIGLDAHTKESIEKDHIVVNTEAHSLHTDRNVGQRTVLLGAHTGGSQTLTNCDLTGLDFSVQPVGSVLKFSHTSNMSSLGGTYIMESKSYTNFFDDTSWGVHQLAGATKTTNPYQTTTYNRTNVRNNQKDKSVKFMVRAIRLLDKSHIEMFRPALATASDTPQRPDTGYAINYFGATVGGKYGMYIYEVTNGRVTSSNFPRSAKPDGNGPYVPVYYIDSANNIAIPTSKGPNIPGTEVSGFDKTTLASTVSRLVMSENTLQHYRSDAPRRRQEKDVDEKTKRMDFSVIPRFSQALHSKGHKGDVNFNISDHSGDAS